MHTIKVWRDPYDQGWNTTRARQIELKPGLTVLVGCNGSGKTTLLNNIEQQIKQEKLPLYVWDNLHDGGSNAMGKFSFHGDFSAMADVMCASEGEAILRNIGYESVKYRKFILTGKMKNENPFVDLLGEKEELPVTNKRFMLFDAADSGLSVDLVAELKNLFNLMLEDAKNSNIELYIIVTCNEFELPKGETCINVASGRYVNIRTYNDFKQVIMHTRKMKNRRYEDE